MMDDPYERPHTLRRAVSIDTRSAPPGAGREGTGQSTAQHGEKPPVRAYDPQRFNRAYGLAIYHEKDRQYFVKSESVPDHWWDVDLDRDPMCHCPDYEWRQRFIQGNCK